MLLVAEEERAGLSWQLKALQRAAVGGWLCDNSELCLTGLEWVQNTLTCNVCVTASTDRTPSAAV